MAGKIHFCLFNVKKKKKKKKIEKHRWVIFLPFTYHFAERLILRHFKIFDVVSSLWSEKAPAVQPELLFPPELSE